MCSARQLLGLPIPVHGHGPGQVLMHQCRYRLSWFIRPLRSLLLLSRLLLTAVVLACHGRGIMRQPVASISGQMALLRHRWQPQRAHDSWHNNQRTPSRQHGLRFFLATIAQHCSLMVAETPAKSPFFRHHHHHHQRRHASLPKTALSLICSVAFCALLALGNTQQDLLGSKTLPRRE